jgi:hypothetical protein
MELSRMTWRKSTRSGTSNCVEVAVVGGQVAIRDSKDRCGPVLIFSASEWEAFVGGVKRGEFHISSMSSDGIDI